MVQQNLQVVGVPVGMKQFKLDFLPKMVDRVPAKFVKAFVPLEVAAATFQNLRLSFVSRLSRLLCTVLPSIKHQAADRYDAVME